MASGRAPLVVFLFLAAAAVYGQNGIVLEKPYPWSSDQDIASVREFSRRSKPTNFENGYNEYFVAAEGQRFSIERDRIAKIVQYRGIGDAENLQHRADLDALLAEVERLRMLAAAYPAARRPLSVQAEKLGAEIRRFGRGDRKLAGTWQTAEELEKVRREAERAHAARLAEEERIAGERKQREKAEIERQAATVAARRGRIAALRLEAVTLLRGGIASAPATDANSVSDVADVSRESKDAVSAFAEKVTRLRADAGHDRDDELEELVELVKALDVRCKAAPKIATGDTHWVIERTAEVLARTPKLLASEQQELRASLAAINRLLKRPELEAQEHVARATSLKASGKMSEALKELQIANSILPNAAIIEDIRKIKEESLGL